MRTILSLFVVLLFVVGCTPDGGDIARDFVEGLGDALEDEFEDEDDEKCVEGEDCYEIDLDLVDEGCELRIVNGRVREVCADDSTEEEINCSDPYLTTIEPLPPGRYPAEVITIGARIEYWACYDSDIAYAYIPRLSEQNSSFFGLPGEDGVFAGGFIPENIDAGVYGDIVDVWEACRVGTQPPLLEGNWVVTEDNQFCYRQDLLPGLINCYPFDAFPDDPATVKQIHRGEVVSTFFFDDDCERLDAE